MTQMGAERRRSASVNIHFRDHSNLLLMTELGRKRPFRCHSETGSKSARHGRGMDRLGIRLAVGQLVHRLPDLVQMVAERFGDVPLNRRRIGRLLTIRRA
jgi:hypothetical protein